MAAASASSSSSAAPKVLVTGGSGFIALHIVHHLLAAGWAVRATVRDPDNEIKTEPLRTLPGAEERLELVKADLLQPADEWAPIIAGCDYVLHTASPFPLTSPKDKSELINPAVQGTLSVVKACIADAGVKRLVVTSSCAAIAYGHEKGLGSKVWTPDDWSDVDGGRIGAYPESKTRAEKAAWDEVKSQPAGRGLELVTINPSMVEGQMLGRTPGSSLDVVKMILAAEISALPDLYMNTVDVSDVARAHVRALVVPEAAGQRFVLGADELSFTELSGVLKAKFGPMGFRPTTMRAPSWLLRFMACFDAVAAASAPNLGQHFRVDNTKTTAVLGIHFRDPRESVIDAAESLVRRGIVADKSKDKRYSEGGAEAAITLPEIAVEGIRPSDLKA